MPSSDSGATSDTRSALFRTLHVAGRPLLLPNPWDAGSARALAALGFSALATTSSGYAATLGRLDGSVTREQALEHAALVVAAADLPVSADLEDCFGADPAGVAETIRLARAAGLAGASIEDFRRDAGTDGPAAIYPLDQAAERVAAAVAAADGLVVTARAENHLHGRDDLADTITRLQRYQQAGADVLYAPGLTSTGDIRSVVSSLDRPVNVLAMASTPPVTELAELGVARISVGGAFAFAALAALAEAGRELLESGTYGFAQRARLGRALAGQAFADPAS